MSQKLTVASVRGRTHTERQAIALVEAANRLRVAPDDVLVDSAPFDRPAGHVLAVVGRRKGRPHLLAIAPDGRVDTA